MHVDVCASLLIIVPACNLHDSDICKRMNVNYAMYVIMAVLVWKCMKVAGTKNRHIIHYISGANDDDNTRVYNEIQGLFFQFRPQSIFYQCVDFVHP